MTNYAAYFLPGLTAMIENTFPPGAITGLVNLNETPSHPRLTREAADLMPLTSEALTEQHLFDATQTLATQHGKELQRTATGYRVSWLGTTRHCIDLHDAADFVRSAHKTRANTNRRPHGQGEPT